MKKHILKRALNFYIDAFFIFLLTVIVLFLISLFNEYAKINRLIIYFIIWFIYYLTLEVVSGKTIGKMITGMKVTFEKEDNKLISVLIRTISRLIPLEPLSIFFNDANIMWHDRLSKTKTINKE